MIFLDILAAVMLSLSACGAVTVAKILPMLIEWLLKRRGGSEAEISTGSVKAKFYNLDKHEIFAIIEKYSEKDEKDFKDSFEHES